MAGCGKNMEKYYYCFKIGFCSINWTTLVPFGTCTCTLDVIIIIIIVAKLIKRTCPSPSDARGAVTYSISCQIVGLRLNYETYI